MDKEIVISIKTILTAALMGVALYLILKLGAIIGIVFIALLITVSMEHTVSFFMEQTFMNRPLNRPLAVLLTYFVVFLSLSILLSVGFDPVITQIQKLLQTLSTQQKVFSLGDNLNFSLNEILASFVSTSGGVVIATKSIFSNAASIFSVLMLSIYMSIDWENIKKHFINIIPEKSRPTVENIFSEIEFNIGHWLRGQLILMAAIGLLSYVGLVLIGVQYPLALGIVSGLMEIVPILGPVISAVVAALVAVVDSPIKAVFAVLVFALIQQLENNILVPKVMAQVTGFSPIIILLVLLIGSELFGIIGAVTAVPVLIITVIIIKNTLIK